MVRSHPRSSSHTTHLSLNLEPWLGKAPDFGVLGPWGVSRDLRGVSLKEGDEKQHLPTPQVKCFGYHPCPSPRRSGDEEVSHEKFATYESLLPLTVRPPDDEDKFARPQRGSRRLLSLNSPGIMGRAPLADRIG